MLKYFLSTRKKGKISSPKGKNKLFNKNDKVGADPKVLAVCSSYYNCYR